MAVNVESMFYTREKPWHGLGTRVEEAPSSTDALHLAGLDWKVLQEPIYIDGGKQISGFLDNGINLKDCQLKNIILMADTEFIQMLGRKRKDGKKVNLYIYQHQFTTFELF